MRYDGDDITFDVPDGWEDRSVVAFEAKRSKPGRSAAGLSLTREPLRDGDTIRRHADRRLLELGREFPNLALLGSGPVQLDGHGGFELRCAWRSASGPIEQRLVLLGVEGSVITLAITGPGGRSEELDAVASQILGTLRLKRGPESSRTLGYEAPTRTPPAPSHRPPLESGVAPPPLFGTMAAPPRVPSPSSSAPWVGTDASGFRQETPVTGVRTLHGRAGAPADEERTLVLLPARAGDPSAMAAARWGCEASAIRVEDLSPRFPWVVRHRLARALGPGGEWLVVASPGAPGDALRDRTPPAAAGAGQPLVFDGQGRIAELNRLLRVENLRLPGTFPAHLLADLATELLAGPYGAVGSPAFLRQQSAHLGAWLLPPLDEAERLFRRHCEAPTITPLDGGHWLLELSYFAARGVVERWIVAGDEQQIRTVDVQIVVKQGRLRFPKAA